MYLTLTHTTKRLKRLCMRSFTNTVCDAKNETYLFFKNWNNKKMKLTFCVFITIDWDLLLRSGLIFLRYSNWKFPCKCQSCPWIPTAHKKANGLLGSQIFQLPTCPGRNHNPRVEHWWTPSGDCLQTICRQSRGSGARIFRNAELLDTTLPRICCCWWCGCHQGQPQPPAQGIPKWWNIFFF